MTIQQHNPLHPGVFLERVYMEPYGLDLNELARKIGVSKSLMSRLINSKVALSPEIAVKVSAVLGGSAESWLQMQNNYDLSIARTEIDLKRYKAISFA